MNAFEFLDSIRANGGKAELVGTRLRLRVFPRELDIIRLNRDLIREVLLNPGRWPCRRFESHPTTPTLPCKVCGEPWLAHPPDLRMPHDHPPSLLTQARAVVAAHASELVIAKDHE